MINKIFDKIPDFFTFKVLQSLFINKIWISLFNLIRSQNMIINNWQKFKDELETIFKEINKK